MLARAILPSSFCVIQYIFVSHRSTHATRTPAPDAPLPSPPRHPPLFSPDPLQVRADKPFRLAIGSFVEEYSNKVEIITLDEDRGTFPAAPQFSFTHPYPCTKILFIPDKECCKEDLVATAGDYLRIWTIREDGVQLASLLNNNKNSEFCAPLTSFDWNETNLARVGTSSLDTTCTIWDIERQVVDTQLIAHDKEVCSRNRTRTEEKERRDRAEKHARTRNPRP